MTFGTKPLAPGLGVEVTTGDVKLLDDEAIAELVALWRSHRVLLFRGQDLDAAAQTAFVAKFGPVGELANVRDDAPETERHVMMIANREYDGIAGDLPDGEMWYHFDQAYLPVPILGGFLYSVEVPKSGGQTLFANAAAAYQSLPEQLKERLDGLYGENVYDYRTTTNIVAEGQESTGYVHPVVIKHPVTGEPTLFVSRLMTRRIIGLPAEESRAVLEDLFERVENQESRYEHHWQVGDLLVWDNRSVLHARTEFDPAEARILRRLSVAGESEPRAFDLAPTQR